MPEKKEMGTQITVMDRGFVYVGKTSVQGDFVTIEDAQNIRRWGATKGLGQLAASGPQPNTVLDPAGTVTAPLRAVIHFVECKQPW